MRAVKTLRQKAPVFTLLLRPPDPIFHVDDAQSFVPTGIGIDFHPVTVHGEGNALFLDVFLHDLGDVGVFATRTEARVDDLNGVFVRGGNLTEIGWGFRVVCAQDSQRKHHQS